MLNKGDSLIERVGLVLKVIFWWFGLRTSILLRLGYDPEPPFLVCMHASGFLDFILLSFV